MSVFSLFSPFYLVQDPNLRDDVAHVQGVHPVSLTPL